MYVCFATTKLVLPLGLGRGSKSLLPPKKNLGLQCLSSLHPHFCMMVLHRPATVRRRFRLDQVASRETGGSDSLALKESLCSVASRWLDQRVSLRVRALPSRDSTE